MFKIRALLLISVFCIVNTGCSSFPSKEEQETQMQKEIRPLSNLSLTSFLPRYFVHQGGEYNAITLEAKFNEVFHDELLRPRLILEIYCKDNNANLSRIPYHQTAWADTAPEAFTDTRTVGYAKISMDSMAIANTPGYGAAKASYEGAFGLFECRENSTDRLLWKATIQGSVGKVIKAVVNYDAVMPITIRAEKL